MPSYAFIWDLTWILMKSNGSIDRQLKKKSQKKKFILKMVSSWNKSLIEQDANDIQNMSGVYLVVLILIKWAWQELRPRPCVSTVASSTWWVIKPLYKIKNKSRNNFTVQLHFGGDTFLQFFVSPDKCSISKIIHFCTA